MSLAVVFGVSGFLMASWAVVANDSSGALA